MESTALPATKPRLRWYQFSLRTLLLVVFLCAIPLGWFGLKLRQAKRQKAALEHLTMHTKERIYSPLDYVHYDFQANDAPFGQATQPELGWLIEWLGVDFFHDVVTIDVAVEEDTHLESLADLPRLRELRLSSNLTDAKVQDVPPLSQLQSVSLVSDMITRRGIEQLQKFPELTSLTIFTETSQGQVRAGLANLPKLTTLHLTCPYFGDTDMIYLKGLTKLRQLRIEQQEGWLSGEGLKYLEGHTQLATLSLTYTDFTEEGLECLATLTSLQELRLQGPRFPPKGIAALQTLTRLRRLDLTYGHLKDANPEVDELRRALPTCEIFCHHSVWLD